MYPDLVISRWTFAFRGASMERGAVPSFSPPLQLALTRASSGSLTTTTYTGSGSGCDGGGDAHHQGGAALLQGAGGEGRLIPRLLCAGLRPAGRRPRPSGDGGAR